MEYLYTFEWNVAPQQEVNFDNISNLEVLYYFRNNVGIGLYEKLEGMYSILNTKYSNY